MKPVPYFINSDGQTAGLSAEIVFRKFGKVNPVFFFKENIRYPVWICRDPISLILGTRFSLILGT